MIAFFVGKIVELIKLTWIDETRHRRGFLIKKKINFRQGASKNKEKYSQPIHQEGHSFQPSRKGSIPPLKTKFSKMMGSPLNFLGGQEVIV